MNIFKKIYNEFVYGGHLLSLGVPAIFLSFAILLEKGISIVFLILGYSLSQIIYGFDHYKDFKKDSVSNPQRSEYIAGKKRYFLFFFFIYILLLIVSLIYLENLKLVLAIVFMLVGGLLSAVLAKRLTRKLVGFKNFYVAFFWAFCIVLASIYFHLNIFNTLTIILFAFVFLRWIVNATFFDIKDLTADKISDLKTLPAIFGKNHTLNYLHLINIISIIPIIYGVLNGVLSFYSALLFIFVLYSFYYLQKAKSKKSDIYFLSYVLADGEYILWPIALAFSKFIFK